MDASGRMLWCRTPTKPDYPPRYSTRPGRRRFPRSPPFRDFTRTEYTELTGQSVHPPEQARPLIAAHQARSALQGATGSEPFFVHPNGPGQASPEPGLHRGVCDLCRDLRVDRSWLHTYQCQRGADIGGAPRLGGWVRHRGLFLIRLREGEEWPRS